MARLAISCDISNNHIIVRTEVFKPSFLRQNKNQVTDSGHLIFFYAVINRDYLSTLVFEYPACSSSSFTMESLPLRPLSTLLRIFAVFSPPTNIAG